MGFDRDNVQSDKKSEDELEFIWPVMMYESAVIGTEIPEARKSLARAKQKTRRLAPRVIIERRLSPSLVAHMPAVPCGYF